MVERADLLSWSCATIPIHCQSTAPVLAERYDLRARHVSSRTNSGHIDRRLRFQAEGPSLRRSHTRGQRRHAHQLRAQQAGTTSFAPLPRARGLPMPAQAAAAEDTFCCAAQGMRWRQGGAQRVRDRASARAAAVNGATRRKKAAWEGIAAVLALVLLPQPPPNPLEVKTIAFRRTRPLRRASNSLENAHIPHRSV